MIPDPIKRANQLDELAHEIDAVVMRLLKQGFNLIAKADDPQAVLNVFGDKASALFNRYGSYLALLHSLGVANVPTPSGEYTINEDGTVTFAKEAPKDTPA